MTSKDEAREALRTVMTDIEAQMVATEQGGYGDGAWDVNDYHNWEAMYDQLIKVAKYAKLNIL